MDICPLTIHWCTLCGSPKDDPVCHHKGESKKIRELKACPLIPFKQDKSGDKAKEGV